MLRANISVKITEDMSRPERIQWGELRKYMHKLSLKQPTAHFFLKNTKLYIDNRSDLLSLQFQSSELFPFSGSLCGISKKVKFKKIMSSCSLPQTPFSCQK